MAPRLAVPGRPARADAADLHDPELPRVGDAEGLGPAAGGQEAVGLDERGDEPDGLAGRGAALQGEDLGLLDGHDLAGDPLDEGDVELGPLGAGALADGQLLLVHLGVAGVEVGEGLLDLGDVADDLAELAERQRPPVVVGPEIDHAPMDRGQRALREAPAGNDLDPTLGTAVGVRGDDRAVGRGVARRRSRCSPPA